LASPYHFTNSFIFFYLNSIFTIPISLFSTIKPFWAPSVNLVAHSKPMDIKPMTPTITLYGIYTTGPPPQRRLGSIPPRLSYLWPTTIHLTVLVSNQWDFVATWISRAEFYFFIAIGQPIQLVELVAKKSGNVTNITLKHKTKP
jgi:hypothetical protein